MDCKKEINKNKCTCSYNCPTKGVCCDCVRFHRERHEIPGCFFPEKFERTYDRSIENFIKAYSNNG